MIVIGRHFFGDNNQVIWLGTKGEKEIVWTHNKDQCQVVVTRMRQALGLVGKGYTWSLT